MTPPAWIIAAALFAFVALAALVAVLMWKPTPPDADVRVITNPRTWRPPPRDRRFTSPAGRIWARSRREK
jgi:hypothetical protein